MPVCSRIEIAFFSESLDASSVTSFKLYGLKGYLILTWFWIATIDLDLSATLSKPLMVLGAEGHDFLKFIIVVIIIIIVVVVLLILLIFLIIELNSLLCFFTKDPNLEAGSQVLLPVHFMGDISVFKGP